MNVFSRSLTVLALAATASLASAESSGDEFVESIEAAHDMEAWSAAELISADAVLSFGGSVRLDGTMIVSPSMNRVRVEYADGTVLGYDGETVWMTPADADMPRARFAIFTWPYFFAAPFKLSDPGTHVEPKGEMPLTESESMATAKLTFGEGVGDAPDDWYVLYRDPETHALKAMSYIVTYGKTDVESAESEPHAIVYDDFQKTDAGFVVPMEWSFHDWSAEKGVFGEALGSAELSNVKTMPMDESLFAKPGDAKVLPAPSN
ncbi:MAG: hypothetical protein RLY93_15750 [Sumerlaeia bacterium]